MTENHWSSLIAKSVAEAVKELTAAAARNKHSSYRTALLIAGGVAVGVAVAYLIKCFMDRYKIIFDDIIVANGSLEPIFVTVEHEKGKNESLIEAGESMKFTVFNNKPTTIRIKKSQTICTYDAEVCIFDYHNYIARKATTGNLILVRAKKGKVWEAEPCMQN